MSESTPCRSGRASRSQSAAATAGAAGEPLTEFLGWSDVPLTGRLPDGRAKSLCRRRRRDDPSRDDLTNDSHLWLTRPSARRLTPR